MPHALIVHAHPESESFCSVQMRAAVQALEESGYTTEISDLYSQSWQPEISRADFEHTTAEYFKPQGEQLRATREGTFSTELAAEIAKVRRADLLVFSFPMWWFSLPAILKGWVDRVFAMGVGYGGEVGRFETGGFKGKRAMLLFTTGSTEDMFGPGARDGEMDVILFHIQHGMFYFCGFDALEPVVSFAPVRQTPEARAGYLEHVRDAFRHVDSRRVLTWNTGNH